MDIVEFLRSVEWMCHSEMRGLMENDRPHEAADEIERLRGEIWEIWEMLESFPSILEVTNTGNMPTDKDHVDAMRKWNKGVKERILKANASWLRGKALGGKK
jgi:hypothetical protein